MNVNVIASICTCDNATTTVHMHAGESRLESITLLLILSTYDSTDAQRVATPKLTLDLC